MSEARKFNLNLKPGTKILFGDDGKSIKGIESPYDEPREVRIEAGEKVGAFANALVITTHMTLDEVKEFYGLFSGVGE